MRKKLLRQWLIAILSMSMLLPAVNVLAVESPHQLVENTTNQILKMITAGKKTFKSNPSVFYQELDKYLSNFFEFRLFAQNVMGQYGSSEAYNKMSAEEKKKFNQRLDRFVQLFKEGLITRYGSSLLLFDGNKVEVVPPTAADNAKIAKRETVIVTQYIYDKNGKRYSAQYTMKPGKEGQWKVRNVTIEGVNVGKIYRSQFQASMNKNKNDIDKVINSWSVAIEEEVKEAKKLN